MPQEAVRGAEISTRDLRELVSKLEDDQRREALLRDLKSLIELQEAGGAARAEPAAKPKERKKSGIEELFLRYESLSRRMAAAVESTTALVSQAPTALTRARSFLSRPENRARLARLLIAVSGSILIALIVGLIVRRFVPSTPEPKRGFTITVATVLLRFLIRLIPWIALLIASFFLSQALPSFSLAHTLTLLLFIALTLYFTAVQIFNILLAPAEERIRILPLSDETANYLWIWVLRFARYAAFYFLVTRTLLILDLAAPSFFLIRGLLLVMFASMLSLFIMQVSREIRTRHGDTRWKLRYFREGVARSVHLLIRYWHLPALVYSWALLLFSMFRYEKGFEYLARASLGTAVTGFAIFLALWLLERLFEKLFTINEKVRERFPGLEEKTNRYILAFRKGMGAAVVLIGVGVIVQVWGIPVSAMVASKTGSMVILRAVVIAMTLGAILVIWETSRFVSDRLLQERGGRQISKKRKTLTPLIRTVVQIAVVFIGGIVVLDQLGVNTAPILAGAGIVGLAVGFGAQTLVKDFINGIFILFADLMSVGDWVVLGDKNGLVEGVGIRTTRLRDLAGNVHVLPNSSIDAITNMTKDFSRYVFDVGVAYREDVDEVMAILKGIGDEMQDDPQFGPDILQPLEVFGLDRFEDSAIVIRARIETRPMRQWAIGREFKRRMKRVFDERGIEIPFPHRTLYMGEPKEGTAPALQVQMKQQEMDSRQE